MMTLEETETELRELWQSVYTTPNQRRAIAEALRAIRIVGGGRAKDVSSGSPERCGSTCRSVETGEPIAVCSLSKGHAGSHIGHGRSAFWAESMEEERRAALLGPLGGGQ